MRRALTGFLVTVALAGSAMAGSFSNGLDRFVAGKPAGESITVLLSMAQQADVAELDAQLSARKATLAERHEVVISSLMNTATRTQTDLLAELSRLKAAGKVNGYTPYWITNAIVVNAPISVLRQLAARTDVAVAEVNLVVDSITPVIPDKGLVIDRDNPYRTVTSGIAAINADDVWNLLGINGTGALVGSIDTGVEGTHPALSANWRGNHGAPVAQCWLDAAGLGHATPTDSHGHGTHTTGTMVGTNDIGVAPGAWWIASNIINSGTGSTFDNGVIASFQFMADPDGNPGTLNDVPDVVQNSWGVNEGFSGYLDCDSRWWASIDNCEAAGVCVTFSAGNEGSSAGTLRSPADRAASPYNCFSVGAVDSDGGNLIASFSSRGPSTCTGGNGAYPMKPEVSAPGVNTYSAYPGGGYTTMSGTSMAGPHVAGVVALMRSANPNVDVSTIKQVLMDTAVDYGSAGEDNDYGHGLIDAYAAVQAVMSGFGTLSGTVTDATSGLPLAGVLVDNTTGPQQMNTNGSGAYSMMLAPGNYTMSYSLFGYVAQSLGVTINADATTIRNVALSQAHSDVLSGVVYGPDSNPIVGAVLDFTNAPVADVTTGAGGFYSVSIPTGYTYDITATAAGVGSQSQSVTFNAAQTLNFNLPINPQFLPSGPDTYGYRIFDSNDNGGVAYDATLNIAGTLAVTGDDATTTLAVPFNFNFYGTSYNQLSVCTNGWVSPGSTTATAYYNGVIPDAIIPGAIYGQWDDLYSVAPNAVYYEYQAAQGRFVVEWDHTSYCCSGGAGPVWMQIILLDPAIYPSESGDAQWIINFGGGDRGSHTTGIDNQAGSTGIQYVYDNSYDVNASSVSSPIALLISTNDNGFGPVSYPNVAVAPASVSETVSPGGTAADVVTVSNSGDGNLTWNASVTTFSAATTVPTLELAKGQADPRPGVVNRMAGGPDAFGYSWADSNEPGGPAYNWFDISGIGTTIGASDDTNYGPFNLGFTFSYYGVDYTSVRVCTNGWLSFTSTSSTLSPQGIPNVSDPNALLAVMMRDLNPGSAGSLKYYNDGASRFIVQWTGVPVYGTSDYQTFQVIINADGSIVYQYQTVVNATYCSVGIENHTGTDGLQTSFNTAYLTNNLAVRYGSTPPLTPWLTVSPTSGSVAAGGSGTFNVNYNAESYAFGTFTGQVNFTCNDPDTPSVTIPVTMIVSGVDNGAPAITHTALTDTEDTVGPYVVSATITDLSGIASAYVSYRTNGGAWNNVAMTGGPVFSASIPGQPYVTAVDYFITAEDNSSNHNSGSTSTYSFDVYRMSPTVGVSPTSLSKLVVLGGTASDLVTVTNSGGSTLNWSASTTTFSAATSVPTVELAKGEVDYRQGEVSRMAGGPDAFGYSWKDSNEPGGPGYNWVDISGIGTDVGAGDDANYGPFNLGFTFSFYGVNYTGVRVCTNGFLSFTSLNTPWTNQGLPNVAAPFDLLAPFWDDFIASASSIKYYADMANQRFIVSYLAIPHYSNSTLLETFQVIINANGSIVYQYQTVADGASCTVGIQNSTGTDGLQVAFNTAYLTNGLAIQFAAQAPWLSLTPSAGSVPVSGSGTFTVNYDATAVPAGTYLGQVNFSNNDPDTPAIVIPVTMVVSATITPDPVSLDITYIGAGQATLSWVAVPFASSYDVYQAGSMGGVFTLLGNTTGTSYTVSTASGTKVYRVVSRNDN